MLSSLPTLTTLICVALVAMLLLAEYRDSTVGRLLTKPWASLAFVATGMLLEGGSGLWREQWLIWGLWLCMGGDIALIFREPRVFLAGLVSFLLGHVCFAVSFLLHRVHPTGFAVGVGVAMIPAVPAVAWMWKSIEPPMRVPVAAYTVVIVAMVGCAASAWWGLAPALIPLGAAAFLLSDLSVALDRFVQRSFVHRAWGLPLYYGSVLTIAWSLAF
jgi:uncharacterized membrane protein YhhN